MLTVKMVQIQLELLGTFENFSKLFETFRKSSGLSALGPFSIFRVNGVSQIIAKILKILRIFTENWILRLQKADFDDLYSVLHLRIQIRVADKIPYSVSRRFRQKRRFGKFILPNFTEDFRKFWDYFLRKSLNICLY